MPPVNQKAPTQENERERRLRLREQERKRRNQGLDEGLNYGAQQQMPPQPFIPQQQIQAQMFEPQPSAQNKRELMLQQKQQQRNSSMRESTGGVQLPIHQNDGQGPMM